MRNLLFIFIVQILFIANLNAANDSILVIRKINLEGNHITHDKIILRELTFKIGDTLSIHNYSIQKEKSSQNLMNISLFNFVNFSEDITNNEISINIRLTERWYIWPIPVFDLADRNFNTWWKTKDFNRINFGVDLAIFNFRGRNETLDLLLSLGYDEKYGIVYKIPYINKKQTLGLVISGNYIRSHEIALKDSNNKVIFLKDQINYPKQSVNTSIGITYRRNIHNFHTFQLEYEKFNFQDTVSKLNPEYTLSKNTENQYFSFYYQYKNDYRDYKPYPLKGHYFDIEIHKYGMDFIDGSKVNLASIKSTYRKYGQINEKLYYATGITAMANSKFPYYIQNGLGYLRDYVRGYEYYVISGEGFGLLKNNLKYAIVPQRIFKFNPIKTEKFNTIPYAFYVNLFADAAYVYKGNDNKYNSLINSFLIGYGLGIDFVTYYDKVLRIEYSINKMGEKGLFIHFMTSI